MNSKNLVDPDGYLWLWKKSIGSRAFKNADLWKVWTWCLMKASKEESWIPFKTGKSVIEVNVKPGQFVFGRKTASLELGMPESSVWKRMRKLRDMENVDINSDRQYSVVSIVNWGTYQGDNKKGNSKGDSQGTAMEQGKKPPPKAVHPEGHSNGDFYLTRKKRKLNGRRLETFLEFWEAFNLKNGKAEAADAWYEVSGLSVTLAKKIVQAAEIEAKRRPGYMEQGTKPKYAQGWLNGRRWEDETYNNEGEEVGEDAVWKSFRDKHKAAYKVVQEESF